jgi:hypothetical protein
MMMHLMIVAVSLSLLASQAFAQTQKYQPRVVLAAPIRAITDPPIVSADRCDVEDNELIIGVELSGQARAYPINQLTGPMREIINDVLAGTAIAATW